MGDEIIPAVFLRTAADESRSKRVTRLRPLGTDLCLAPPKFALRVIRILKDRVRSFAQPFSKCRELDVRIGQTIRDDRRCQVQFPQPLDGLGL